MTILLLTCILVAAHVIETITGFGATIIALSLGAHLLPVEVLVVALVLVAWIQSAWLISRGFRHIDWRTLTTRILPFSAVGFPVGIWSFRVLPGEALKLLLGAFVVTISLAELYRLYRLQASPRALPLPATAGLLGAGGFFHGLFASGGPLVVYYASRALAEKGVFRATLSVLWITLNTVLIVSYGLSGRLGERPLTLALYFLPALACGILAGELLHSRVNQGTFKKLVQFVLFFTGISLLL